MRLTIALIALVAATACHRQTMTEGDCIRFVEHYEDCMTGRLAGQCSIDEKDIRHMSSCTDQFHTARDAWHAKVQEN